MAVHNVEEFGAWDFAGEFKEAVYALIRGSISAQRAYKFRDQTEDAAGGIERAMAEGFARRNPAEFASFLRYALGSLAEATNCVRDGIQRGYFEEKQCAAAWTWAERCKSALNRLYESQLREAERRRRARRKRNHPWRPRSPPTNRSRRKK